MMKMTSKKIKIKTPFCSRFSADSPGQVTASFNSVGREAGHISPAAGSFLFSPLLLAHEHYDLLPKSDLHALMSIQVTVIV